jgi:lipopolysaccharide biosynthesis glycosyltransferase
MASILINFKKDRRICFHLIHSDLLPEDYERSLEMRNVRAFDLEFIPVNRADYQKWAEGQDMKWLSVGTYYRFGIPEVVPQSVSRVLYLDSDIVVDADLSELWEIDLSGCYAGVVEEFWNNTKPKVLGIKHNRGFNAGVVLMNLDEIRKSNYLEDAFEYLQMNRQHITCHDQSILNGIWSGKVKYMDPRFNAVRYNFIKRKKIKTWGFSKIINPATIHYTRIDKPWKVFCEHSQWKKYFDCVKYTPFAMTQAQYNWFRTKRFLASICYIKRNVGAKKRLKVELFRKTRFSICYKTGCRVKSC